MLHPDGYSDERRQLQSARLWSKAVRRGPHGRSHTKPGSLLKSQIPIRSWAQWDNAVPGFVEIDLVGHEGGAASGQYCFTLTVTDIATGWRVNRSVPNKSSASRAPHHLHPVLPEQQERRRPRRTEELVPGP